MDALLLGDPAAHPGSLWPRREPLREKIKVPTSMPQCSSRSAPTGGQNSETAREKGPGHLWEKGHKKQARLEVRVEEAASFSPVQRTKRRQGQKQALRGRKVGWEGSPWSSGGTAILAPWDSAGRGVCSHRARVVRLVSRSNGKPSTLKPNPGEMERKCLGSEP